MKTTATVQMLEFPFFIALAAAGFSTVLTDTTTTDPRQLDEVTSSYDVISSPPIIEQKNSSLSSKYENLATTVKILKEIVTKATLELRTLENNEQDKPDDAVQQIPTTENSDNPPRKRRFRTTYNDDLTENRSIVKNADVEKSANISLRLFIDALWIDEFKMELGAKLLVTEIWRQESTPDSNKRQQTSRIYFRNSVKVEKLSEQRKSDSEDDILHKTTEYMARFLCPMEFQKYPMDQQQCRILIEPNFLKKSALVKLTFVNVNPVIFGDSSNPITPGWYLANTDVMNFTTYSSNASPCLIIKFTFSRRINFTLLYVPYILLLIVVYVSYYLGRKKHFLRLMYTFIVGILLCFTAAYRKGPGASSQTAAFTTYDFWTAMTFVFYFGALLHTAFILRLDQKGRKNPAKSYYVAKARLLDRLGMFAYPIALVIWFIIYFVMYCNEL